ISKLGTLLRTIDTRESGRNFSLRQKTWHVARGALRWHQIPRSTMKYPNACMRHWGMRWWTAVCITVRRCNSLPFENQRKFSGVFLGGRLGPQGLAKAQQLIVV